MSDSRLFETRHGVTFLTCVAQCLDNSVFVAEWERLSNKKLLNVTPLEHLIDETTGYDQVLLHEFLDFVYETVFLTL